MWILRAFGAGARFVCTYRYRQPLFGSELYHKGLAETDGVTPSPGGREYAQAMRDVIELRKHYDPNAREPQSYAARRTAFLISYDNRWDISNHKQTTRWDTVEHWMRYYRALKSMMAPVDVLTSERDFSHLSVCDCPGVSANRSGVNTRFHRVRAEWRTPRFNVQNGPKRPAWSLVGSAMASTYLYFDRR